MIFGDSRKWDENENLHTHHAHSDTDRQLKLLCVFSYLQDDVIPIDVPGEDVRAKGRLCSCHKQNNDQDEARLGQPTCFLLRQGRLLLTTSTAEKSHRTVRRRGFAGGGKVAAPCARLGFVGGVIVTLLGDCDSLANVSVSTTCHDGSSSSLDLMTVSTMIVVTLTARIFHVKVVAVKIRRRGKRRFVGGDPSVFLRHLLSSILKLKFV